MKERPILFSGGMVQAILEGRKTQTRRVVTPAPFSDGGTHGPMWGHASLGGFFAEHVFGPCFAKLTPRPYAAVGERLWVRETWRGLDLDGSTFRCQYALPAGGERFVDVTGGRGWLPIFRKAAAFYPKWRPGIHMPREASRILLEVTEVRVQRLHEISEEDAKAEGVPPYVPADGDGGATEGPSWNRIQFSHLWDSINLERSYQQMKGTFSWKSNPFVWCLSFRVVK